MLALLLLSNRAVTVHLVPSYPITVHFHRAKVKDSNADGDKLGMSMNEGRVLSVMAGVVTF